MDYNKIAAEIYGGASLIWHYGVIKVAQHYVTIGNLITAIIFFIAAWRISKALSKLLYRLMLERYEVDLNTALIIERATYYFANFIIITIALQIANIPIGSFAFIGGSLAIAIGLGAQHLVGNIISSILIMVEKSLKIGDVVEINGPDGKPETKIIGRVTQIRSRCTVITMEDGAEAIIPNGELVQNKLINWTLEDKFLTQLIDIKITRSANKTPQDYIELLKNSLTSIKTIMVPPVLVLAAVDGPLLLFTLTFQHKFISMEQMRGLIGEVGIIVDTVLRNENYSFTPRR